MVHDNCLEYEMILGNGELVSASPEENADLFYGSSASYGSLGITTLIKVSLVPAKVFVELSYLNVRSYEEVIEVIKEKSKFGDNFIDAIMFSRSRGVIMTGNFSEKKDLPIITFHKATDQWFYLHADKISKNHDNYRELIPTEDYFFRYDKGAYWMGYEAFKVVHIPFNRVTRYLLDGICGTKALWMFLDETRLAQEYVIQDFNLPSENSLKFMEFIDEKLKIFPIWICPLKPGRKDKLSANYIATDLVYNIGVWGKAKTEMKDPFELNRFLENQ